MIGGDGFDLLPGAEQGDLGVEAVGECRGDDFRPDPARVTQGDGEPGPPGHGQRMSTKVRRRSSPR